MKYREREAKWEKEKGKERKEGQMVGTKEGGERGDLRSSGQGNYKDSRRKRRREGER